LNPPRLPGTTGGYSKSGLRKGKSLFCTLGVTPELPPGYARLNCVATDLCKCNLDANPQEWDLCKKLPKRKIFNVAFAA
jgi:hypothetical protein